MMCETAQNLVVQWWSTLAVRQRSGEKHILATHMWVLLNLGPHGVVDFKEFR
jgi:hypothetical protein